MIATLRNSVRTIPIRSQVGIRTCDSYPSSSCPRLHGTRGQPGLRAPGRKSVVIITTVGANFSGADSSTSVKSVLPHTPGSHVRIMRLGQQGGVAPRSARRGSFRCCRRSCRPASSYSLRLREQWCNVNVRSLNNSRVTRRTWSCSPSNCTTCPSDGMLLL